MRGYRSCVTASILAALAVLAGLMPTPAAAQSMILSSPAFTAGGAIPESYSCQGAELSPPLHWTAPPPGTQSLALIVDDPDAPAGDWVHWVVYDLPADMRTLPSAAADHLPAGAVTGVNSWGKAAYGGMCPPAGSHHYRFQLYALDTQLALASAHKRDLLTAMQGHVLARARLVGVYRRRP